MAESEIAASDNSLRHAISLHPRPFHFGTDRDSPYHTPQREPSPASALSPTRSPIPTEGRPVPHGEPTALSTTISGAEYELGYVKPASGDGQGKSTSYEATTPPNETHDPVARPNAGTRQSFDAQDELERQPLPKYTKENDPFQLSTRLKSASEIDLIKANTSRKRESASNKGGTCGGPSIFTKGKDAWHARKVQGFYEKQNENIERLLKPVDDHRREAKDTYGENQLNYKIAVQGSFIANVLLAALQLYGAASSGSLSLFTTMADALFDPLSNVTLILSNRAVNRVDPRKFPSGKARIETAGNIVFCFLMTCVSFIIIVQSIQELVRGSSEETKGFHLPSVIAVAIAFTTKFCLFLYCWSLRNLFSQIKILWEDHRNDLIINGFGLLTSIGGSKLKWWIDPAGAIILSCLIVFLWLRTAYSEFQLLIGVSADTQMLQLITYISMTHSPEIRQIDTVRAWHSGPRLIVEVDIVMDPEDSLRHTHDTAEELQLKLENLPNVERAYVHVDFETTHKPEHFLKKEL